MQISKYVIACATVLAMSNAGFGAGLQHPLATDHQVIEAAVPGNANNATQAGVALYTPVVATRTPALEAAPVAGALSEAEVQATLDTHRAGVATPIEDPRARADYQRGLDAYQLGNYSTALKRWESAAERGHLVAQWNLVRLYTNGEIVQTDAKRALYYLRSIAAKLDPNQPPSARSALKVAAYVELGRRYLDGVPEADLEPSPARAFRLFE
ncbi:MAG: hypothetical protein ACTSUY_10420, partial [Alphaproteobacteria bacterium]